MECGSNVNATDADGWTALHFACAEARVEIAQVLLLHGARPSSVTRDGRLPRDVCNSEGILTLLKRREEEDLRLRRQRMMETALSAAEQREAEERAAQMRDLEARVTRAESMLSESLRENEVLRDTVAQLAEGLPSDLLAMLSEQAAKTSGAGEAQQDVAGTADAAAADKASGSGEVEAAAAPSGSAETVLLQEVRRLSCLVQRARSFGTGPVQMFEESTLDEVLLQPQAFERTDEVVWESPYSRIAEGRAVGGRAVVLKRIKLAESARAAVQHVVFDDVALCRTLRHPNLVVFVGVCLAPHLELAFASVSGPSLHVLLHGPEARDLPLRAKYRIMRGICNGFVYLHERCVFHQRFSSFHVLLSEGGEPRLCGFAMPHTMLAVRGPRPQGQWRRWCSPEVAAAPAGELSMWMNSEKPDVYSFGMVCWELCSELEPFGDVKSDDAVVERIARGEQAFSDDGKSGRCVCGVWVAIERTSAHMRVGDGSVQGHGTRAVCAHDKRVPVGAANCAALVCWLPQLSAFGDPAAATAAEESRRCQSLSAAQRRGLAACGCGNGGALEPHDEHAGRGVAQPMGRGTGGACG